MLGEGLLWLPAADEQCSEVYFFLGTRALKVAVFRLEAGFGLLLALGVLLLLQLLPPLSLWLLPLTADLPDLSSEDVNILPESRVTSDSLSPSEVSRALMGSTWGDSECEVEEKEEEGVRFWGDLLLSLFSSESLFSPPSGASPAPRRFPPLARVEGGEWRPCFLIGFIFSCSFSPNNFLFVYPRDSLWLCLDFWILPPPFCSLYFPPLLGPLSLILSRLRSLTSALAHLIPKGLKEEKQGVMVTHVINTIRHAQSRFRTQEPPTARFQEEKETKSPNICENTEVTSKQGL